MPFLFNAPTIGVKTPLMVPWNSVGVLQKSLSNTCCTFGTSQEPTSDRFERLSSTSAGANVSDGAHFPGLPVAKYTVPAVSSMAGEPHILPPVQPLFTTLKVFKMVPVVASSW